MSLLSVPAPKPVSTMQNKNVPRSQGPHRDLVISDNIKIMSAKGIFSLRSLWFILPHTVLFRLLGIEFLNGAGEGVEPEVGGVALVEEGTAQEFHIAELACGKLGGDERL